MKANEQAGPLVPPPEPPPVRRRFGIGWLGAGGLALVLPKCLGCVLGYAVLLSGPELCGATEASHPWIIAGVVLASMVLTVAAVYDRRIRKTRRS